ncbi:hypothetical protein HMPREF9154_2148 [Arachnia propionica F0230a]|nr:hypothetical protein HMPREF9154_2148 [Arachnia propionica F0230a]
MEISHCCLLRCSGAAAHAAGDVDAGPSGLLVSGLVCSGDAPRPGAYTSLFPAEWKTSTCGIPGD